MRPLVTRALFAVLLSAATLEAGAPSNAARAEGTQAGAIRQVIENQLAAFQRDAGREAFSYASPGIQRQFGSAEVFMGMVRQGYPQVYRPQAVQFEDFTAAGAGRAVQEVFFVGPDGSGSLALYFMERQPDGSWKIDGVEIQRLPDTTA
jgi:hypothetical protein